MSVYTASDTVEWIGFLAVAVLAVRHADLEYLAVKQYINYWSVYLSRAERA